MKANGRKTEGFGSRRDGVTLIELMIVITIIGALTAISIPAYRGYAQRAQRTLATEALLNLAQNQENYRNVNNTYTDDLDALGFPGGCSVHCVYTIDFTVAPDTQTYTARATPTAGGGTNGVDQTSDTDCQEFTIDPVGRRESEPGENCWGG